MMAREQEAQENIEQEAQENITREQEAQKEIASLEEIRANKKI